jgi:type I restriction enzyme S subunit
MKKQSSGGVQSFVSLTFLRNYLFPLPPLAEQQRIVAKVDELMALCDELEAVEQELEALESRFEEYLPKSILQAAVQGKLVPQDIHDEPASVLLERIRAEKARLVKEGKIKKEKPLSPITEDEIPYDLPEGWVWCRFGDIIIQNIGGGTPSKQNPAYWNGNIPWASVKDLTGTILNKTQDCITELGLKESSSNLIPADSIIVCTRMGLGKIAINTIPVAINQDLRALIISRMNIDLRYVIAYYKTLNIRGEGTTVKGISIEELHNMLFPLPPVAEQQRIVAKVNELMALCEEIKAVKTKPIERGNISNVINFTVNKQEEQLQLAARGEISKKPSAELLQAIDDMFAEDE